MIFYSFKSILRTLIYYLYPIYNLSQEYLNQIRKVFEPRYKRKLTDEEVEKIDWALINFGKVVKEFYQKKKELYGDKYEIWLKENIINGLDPDEYSEYVEE
jgi:hypothetical protein